MAHGGRDAPRSCVGDNDASRMETTRVDRWLFAVRVFKTRSAATAACAGGHVELNGSRAKPASSVRVGDRVQVHEADHRVRILEVSQVIDRRVGAPVAAGCFIDHSPPAPPEPLALGVLVRDRSAGRPTKRERRQLDRLRGR